MDYGESFGVFSMMGAREVESCEAEKLKFGEMAPESSGKSQQKSAVKICPCSGNTYGVRNSSFHQVIHSMAIIP